MYGLSIDGEKAYVVLKTQQLEKATEVIKEKGIGTLTTEGVNNTTIVSLGTKRKYSKNIIANTAAATSAHSAANA